MKKYFFALPAMFLFLVSCGKKSETKNDTSTKDTSKVTVIDSLAFEVDTFHVVETEKKCPNGDCGTADLYYEKIRKPLKPVHDSVNRYIDTLVMQILSEVSDPSLKYDLKKRAESFFATKRELEDSESESGGAWDYEMHVSIFRSVNEIFTVSAGWGGYTGGAHPNYTSSSTSFFTSTGKQVTMNDLFKDVAAVNKIGVKYFKKDNQLDPNTDCSEQGWDFSDEDFQLNENFDVSMDAITWQFNSYEIGPYSAGAPSVTIPMKELSDYLKVKFTEIKIK